MAWEGRLGAATSVELIARAAMTEEKHAQPFPDFGRERREAPVLAFLRIIPEFIRIRTDMYEPDVVVIIDPKLLHAVNVTSQLKNKGKILVKSRKS